ncbi:MAG: TetR/AcrR family transcriptional regulator [Pseudomonadales bacterium]|nr:TetR/AcrR family transcriptional regulator [Pseudomonadales bacterium]
MPSVKENATTEAEEQPLGWQAQKSAATRNLILDAAITCFIDLGYAMTTTAKISNKAGLSRGAMLHHFPSKSALIQAAVEYLHRRRLDAFRDAVSRIPADETDRIRAGINVYWQHLTSPLFVAFHELAVAARTDSELGDILYPAVDSFDQAWYETAKALFPEWEKTGDVFDLAMDLTQNLMEGMAINHMQEKDEQRAERLLTFLAKQLESMLEESNI